MFTQPQIQLSPAIKQQQETFKYSGLLVLTRFVSKTHNSFLYLPQTYNYFCTYLQDQK